MIYKTNEIINKLVKNLLILLYSKFFMLNSS